MSNITQPDSIDQLHYLQRIFDNSINGIMVFRAVRDAENRIVDFEWVMCNRKAGEITGMPAEELVGKCVLQVMPETLNDDLFAQYVQVIETGKTADYDHHHKYEDFQPWLHVTATKLDDGFVAIFTDVSHQKWLQDDLISKHSELDRFFLLSTEMLCIANTDGYFLKVNKAWEDILGYTIDEIETRSILDFIHPDDVETTVYQIAELSAQNPVMNFINRYRHKDGSYRFIEWRGVPQGKMIYAAARDITRQRELEAYQSHLVSIFNSTHSGIIGKDLNGVITAWNPGAELIYGYTALEMIGQPIDRLMPKERIDELAFNLDHAKTGGFVERYETERIHKDGRRLNVALTISPIKDKHNQVIGVSSVNQDIGELKQAQDALRESEARYRAIVNTMTGGVLLQLRDGTIEACNSAAERILGLTLDQMMRRAPVDFDWRAIHEDGMPIPITQLPHVLTLTTGVPQTNIIMGICKNDERPTWILVNSQPLTHPGSALPYATVSTFVDITERKQVEEQRLLLQLEKERVKLLSQFIEQSSHEFRTPLTIMQSSLTVLRRTQDPTKHEQKADVIESQIEGLTRLVDMLQCMNQLDNRTTAEFGEGHVNDIVAEVIAKCRYMASEANVTMGFNAGEGLPSILLSEDYLQEAIRQLVENAIRYTPAHGQVSICTGEQDGSIVIAVSDTGIGIAPENLPRIFERFYRQDHAYSTPGFGLGLPIAQSIVKKHGGTLLVESVPDKGSVFRILLPIP